MKVTELNQESPPSSGLDEGTYIVGGQAVTFKGLLKKEVSMGGQQFRILKMLPIEAKDLWNRTIRPCLSSLDGVQFHEKPSPGGQQDGRMPVLVPRPWPIVAIEVFGKIPYPLLEEMSQIFQERSIEFKNGGTWMKVALDSGKAFEKLDPAELVLLDLMAFAQNFKGSVSVLGRVFLVQIPTETDK